MSSLDAVRDFLQRYQSGQSYPSPLNVPTEGDPPIDIVRKHQRATGQVIDEHVIPRGTFEYRTGSTDGNGSPGPNDIRTAENMHLLELYWDTLVGQYGFDGVTTYVPFHENEEAFGIYISQRGIRYLGHLLYHWSRATTRSDDPLSALSGLHLEAGSELFRQPAAFGALEDAFELAEEMLVRYQWFHHQVELLATYVEDIQNELCYPSYHQGYRDLQSTGADTSRSVGHLYVARSRACRNRAPKSLFEPLLDRALNPYRPRDSQLELSATNGFETGRHEVSRGLLQGIAGSDPNTGFELSQQLPFATDVGRAIPQRIAVYITRREGDPPTSSYTNRPGVVSLSPEKYAIKHSDTYQKKYQQSNADMRERLNKTVEKIRNRYEQQNWKGKTDGPNDMRYIDVNGPTRLVVQVDDNANEVELVDFGPRMKVPPKYGLHKS